MVINTKTTRVLRMKQLKSKYRLHQSTIYELVATGKFPAPFKLVPGGRAVGWFEHDIDAWLIERQKNSEAGNPSGMIGTLSGQDSGITAIESLSGINPLEPDHLLEKNDLHHKKKPVQMISDLTAPAAKGKTP